MSTFSGQGLRFIALAPVAENPSCATVLLALARVLMTVLVKVLPCPSKTTNRHAGMQVHNINSFIGHLCTFNCFTVILCMLDCSIFGTWLTSFAD